MNIAKNFVPFDAGFAAAQDILASYKNPYERGTIAHAQPAEGFAGYCQTDGTILLHAPSADEAYEAIRASKTDVAQIAENTGFKLRNIQKVKNHLFTEPHLLDRYVHLGEPAEFRTFDSDLRIADAWARLQAGTFTAQDLQLLRHETAEAWYMRRHGPSYTAAHDAAHARFPSPFESPPVR